MSNPDIVESSGGNSNSPTQEYQSLLSAKIRTYNKRWLVLFVAFGSIFLRGFNESCYGTINNIFVDYFNVAPWQVDWFILTQSVVYVIIAVPMSWIKSRIGFRQTYNIMTSTFLLGFTLITIGMSTKSGYVSVIIGEAILGVCYLISWSIPPPTAAVWFPTREVATAVAIQVVGRGLGESVGSVLSPELITIDQNAGEIRLRLIGMFSSVTILAGILTVCSLLFVTDSPPLPPSEAQVKAIQERKDRGDLQNQNFGEALSHYKKIMKTLFTDWHFVGYWYAFAVANPVLRNNSVLLSSILHQTFPEKEDIDAKAGLVLMGGWITYTIGGFIAGPLITKTKRFKEIVLVGLTFESLSCLAVMLGTKFKAIDCVYAGVLTQGIANTSLFEIIVETTYPIPAMLVTMFTVIGIGIIRMSYPIVGRFMLMNIGATACTAVPFVCTLLAAVVVAALKPRYKRQEAESGSSLDPNDSAND